VDARFDRLAWDLGDPTGEMSPFGENCGYEVQDSCADFHPMKGPMLTQTLQDIIGKEPHHWRGDKTGLEAFSGAFTGLQGDDTEPTGTEMQEFEDFLATIFFPPNPFRNFDNTLPTSLPLTGHFSSGKFARQGGLALGEPMPAGNVQNGMDLFQTRPQHIAGPGPTATCRICHTFPTGQGADVRFVGDRSHFPEPGSGVYEPMLAGPDGEHHLMSTLLTIAGSLRTFKVPHLRNLNKRVGFERALVTSRSGFGFLHDGGEALASFLSRFPEMTSDQEVADFIAFLLSFPGSDLPQGALDNLQEPPGPASQDSHAAVGKQVTVNVTNTNDPAVIARLDEMIALADLGKVGWVAKGLRAGVQRGYSYIGGGVFQSDRAGETATKEELRLGAAAPGAAMTFTVVPKGSETRIGIDRDLDGILDADDSQLTPSSRIRASSTLRRLPGASSLGQTLPRPNRGH
jgi:hypothetical protein